MPIENENKSALLLRAFILDTQIEHPEQVVITNGDKSILLSELFEQVPSLREEMIQDRAEIYCQLGWEVPKC